MKENRFFQESSVTKTREFKVYSNCKEFINDFATGKILLAVLIKLQPDDESVYVCYEDKDKNWFLLEKIRFKDENGCTRFNLYYAPFLSTQENIISVETRDKILDRILGYAIIHPMVTRDMKFKISWGHTVLTNCWRIRTATGLSDFIPNISDPCF